MTQPLRFYKPEHYENAENALRLLRQCGVTILAADDGNMQVLFFKDATATFDSFSGKHEVVKFG